MRRWRWKTWMAHRIVLPEAVTAIEFGASAEDLARTSHAHPTLAETLKEASMAVDGRAIHF